MTRAQQDRIEELLRRIAYRHCDLRTTRKERTLREVATHQDAQEALAILHQDRRS